MSRVIFDIETLGKDFDDLDEPTQEYLMKWASTEEERQGVKDGLSFYPHTSEVIALGMYNIDSGKGVVHYQAPGEDTGSFEEDGITYAIADEKGILTSFWDVIPKYSEFVTFNGRGFDCPFIMVRSAVHRIRPTRDLMPNRYSGPHIDLMDQLSFLGASRRKFNLDMWCRTFGITSPKEKGIKGEDVKELFSEGRYLDIAKYCGRDIKATGELFTYWERYIKFDPRKKT
jgi:DNA polymerase III epsilon subunit-like protein